MSPVCFVKHVPSTLTPTAPFTAPKVSGIHLFRGARCRTNNVSDAPEAFTIRTMEAPMEALMERLTTSEAAVAAGVSVPQIHRIIDEKILPEDLYSISQMRTFRTDACVLIAFYFETADQLTAQARLRTIRNAMAHCSGWAQWENCIVEDHLVTVRFHDIWKGVDTRLHQLMKAREAVTEDPEILGGIPVIKGTRVPVYDIA